MKYTIYINQLAYHGMGLCGKLDITDMAILDYIHGWCAAPRADRIIIDQQEYTRINYTHLIEEMPILGIKKKDTVSARISKLRAEELVKTFRAKDNTLYLRLTNKCYDLFFSDNDHSAAGKRQTYPKKRDRLSKKTGQDLSQRYGQLQTYNYDKPPITTTGPVVVPDREIGKVRDILSAMNMPYEGITDRLISDLITEKGFSHVFETARKIASQYQPGSQPVSNPPGHFKFLVMEGMEAPKGYLSRDEEDSENREKTERKSQGRKKTNDSQDEGPSREEVRNFVDQFCRSATRNNLKPAARPTKEEIE